MWIVRLALRRPYTFIVAALVLLLLTPVILLRTPTDIFPNIDIPVVSIIWQYSGLNAQEIEQRIVYIHERSLTSTVGNIEHMESNSVNGVGIIKVFFYPEASIDAAVSQVTAIAQTVLKQLPPGATPPLIIRYNASNVPVLQYGLSSNTLSEQEIFDVALNQLRIGLAVVNGAAIPYPFGGKTRIVNVDLDPAALQSRGLTPADVVNAVNAQNLILPSGSSKIGGTEYDIELNASPKKLEELNDLPVKMVNGVMVYVHDVAHVRDGYQPQQNIVHQDGLRGALVTIYKLGNASTLDVVSHLKRVLPKLVAGIQEPVDVRPVADQSLFVRAAIEGVIREGVIAACLTALMILLFLGNWRSTLVIAISIPLSVLASIAVLSVLGSTINLMTLGGPALAVGILVDDATVEIENIERNLAQGKELKHAILDGAQQIALPAFVSTLCICIVFLPMFFLEGVAKYLFVPLAEAVVFAMLASYVLSRTLVPTLVMYLLRNHRGHIGTEGTNGDYEPVSKNPFVRIQRKFEKAFASFRESYRQILEWSLEHRMAIFVGFALFLGVTALLIPFLGQDFFPKVDGGQFRLHLRAKSGMRIEETARLVDLVEQRMRSIIRPEDLGNILDNIGIPTSGTSLSYANSGVIGTADADILVTLNAGHRPTEEYEHDLRLTLTREFPNTDFYFLAADIIGQTLNFGLPSPFDIQFVGRKVAENRKEAALLAERIRKIPGMVDVRIQQPADQPKLRFAIDRTKAAEVGLTERDVANNVLLTVSGSSQVNPGYWLNPANGISYLINARVPEYQLDTLDVLNNIPVSGGQLAKNNGQVLSNVSTMTRGSGPVVLSHYNVQPVIDLYGGVAGRDLGGVLRDVEPLVAEAQKHLSAGNQIIFRGQAQTMQESFVGLGWGLVFAIALIYLLLVVNFQSWLDPFIIITALPGALAGVVWMLFVTRTTLSVPALMGSIMSLGVATANSVLVVTFAREAMAGGAEAIEASLLAGYTRLRPVVMTALAMIIGMLPMALGLGEGGEQNAPLGRAVIGGLLCATLATLFFVPIVFGAIHRRIPVSSGVLLPDEEAALAAA